MSARPSDAPVPTIIALFRRISRLMVDELLGRLAAAGYPGVSASEHLMFENLPPDGARVTELAARVGMTHQAAGELVGAMQARGFLERRADPADGRARIVVLTPEGRKLVHTALREIAAIERRWAGYLADAGLPGELRPALTSAVERARALDTAEGDRLVNQPESTPGGAAHRRPSGTRRR